jgi:hypothetical protein
MMPLSLRQTTDDDRRLGGDFIFWDSFGDREIPNFPEGPYIDIARGGFCSFELNRNAILTRPSLTSICAQRLRLYITRYFRYA